MMKYAILVNEKTKQCQVGVGDSESAINFYKSQGMIEMDVEKCNWNGNWYLKGHCPQQPELTKEEKISKLKIELAELDSKAIRPLRAIASGQGTEADTEYLNNIEAQAEEKRRQIRELEEL